MLPGLEAKRQKKNLIDLERISNLGGITVGILSIYMNRTDVVVMQKRPPPFPPQGPGPTVRLLRHVCMYSVTDGLM